MFPLEINFNLIKSNVNNREQRSDPNHTARLPEIHTHLLLELISFALQKTRHEK